MSGRRRGDVADTVCLDVPRDAGFLPLLHLVLGGIALRRSFSFDDLDDLQLAVDNILAEDLPAGGTLSMAVTVSQDAMSVRLQPLRNADLRSTLAQGQVPVGAEGRCIEICILLRSLVDEYTLSDLGDGTFAVELRKLAA
jgi:hypothetical protein